VPLAGRPTAALAVLALAAVSDVLDGWLARRSPRRLTWEPSKGSQTLPRWSAASNEGARSAGGAGWAVRPEVPEGGSPPAPHATCMGGLGRMARSGVRQVLHYGGDGRALSRPASSAADALADRHSRNRHPHPLPHPPTRSISAPHPLRLQSPLPGQGSHSGSVLGLRLPCSWRIPRHGTWPRFAPCSVCSAAGVYARRGRTGARRLRASG